MDLTSTENNNLLNQTDESNPLSNLIQTQVTLNDEDQSDTEEPAKITDLTQTKSNTINSDEDEEDEVTNTQVEKDNESVKKVMVNAEVLDKETGTEITGGHIMTPATSTMPLSAYPCPGEMELLTINPLLQLRKPGFVPTANLPLELQLWWNFHSETHVSDADMNLWAMVKPMSDTRMNSTYESVKLSLSSFVSYFETILGPGLNQFILIRFKNATVKETLQQNTRLDCGVLVIFNGSTRTSLLIFNLEPISKLTPIMSSLLVAVTGLPFHLRHRNITEELFEILKAHGTNDRFQITFIREPNTSPAYTFNGARIFEIHFEQKAASHWFDVLSQDKGYLTITPWN
ncbi:uncharacterized protein MELLADRAFT_65385 [Melampsora larici-populina 98AG31]|uniref:Uncharacterized protein n=1 Tax=Melampsora larici-populina (strain 98AG31 / pathotype 3-4-7) TaxID=747676 RepID=F4RV54_MELLP|nr:uncharacterized protein MELLADRAFT_65385 [Melampsora larici-populina 98AG31]EGG03725.1 hypothetical protein MELLADRAFT_65385 [Melampsora larici-populina 98AG31]